MSGTNSPASIIFNVSGSEGLIVGGSPLAPSQPGFVLAGSDGSNVRLLRVETDGALRTTGSIVLSGTSIVSVSNFPATQVVSQGTPNDVNNAWPVAASGLLASSYSPDPSSYVTTMSDQVAIDASNRLETHSTVTTDEFSFRTDFVDFDFTTSLTGTATFANGSTTVTGSGTTFTMQVRMGSYVKLSTDSTTAYALVAAVIDDTTLELETPYAGSSASGTGTYSDFIPQLSAGSSIVVSNSVLTMSVSTTTGTGSFIQRKADYLPLSVAFIGSISQRIDAQTGSFGLRDVWDGDAQKVVEVRFHGTDASTVEFASSFGSGSYDTQTTTGIPIPVARTTSTAHTYKIDLSHDTVTLVIDDIVSAIHTVHIPGPYDLLSIFAGIQNSGTPASATSLLIDSIYFDNFNRVETRNSNKGEPDPVQIVGVTPAGVTKTVGVTTSADLQVEIGGSNVSSFGDVITVGQTPVIQFDFVGQTVVSGTFNQYGGPVLKSGGTATTSAGLLQLNSNTNSDGAAVFMSRLPARYRAGQGITTRFSANFGTPAANNIQVVGMTDASITWTNNATAPGPPITGVDVGDGYFFGYNGTSFGIRHKNARTGLDTWTPRTSWNVDRCDGTRSIYNATGLNWNPQFGNVMMIRYPYLGYGDIKFYVQNPDNGQWILCHVIKYTNSTSSLQVSNPSMYFFGQTKNTGNTTNVRLSIGSVGVFIDGERKYLGPSFGLDARRANNGTNTELPVLSLRNCTSFNGNPNRGVVRLRSVSFSGDGAGTDSRFRIRRAPTLTGATFVNAINGTITGGSTGYILTNAQSIVTADTAATAVAAVTLGASDVVFNGVASRSTGYQIDLTPYDIFMAPGETLTFTMTSTSNGNAVQVAVNWHEDT